MKPQQRRLSAIVFTDIVGYSAIVHRDEALGAKLLDRQRVVVRRLLKRFGGREVDTIGDGFLLEFGSALAAVQAVTSIQQELARQNETEPEASRVLLRASVHLGDVEHRGKDVYGDGVNIAARIMPFCPPGGLALSAPVLHLVRQRLPLPASSIGSPELKNISTPVEIFTLTPEDLGQLAIEVPAKAAPVTPPGHWLRWALPALVACIVAVGAGFLLKPGAATALDKSVAVLPFTNMSEDQSNQYFSDGMQDEILTAIAKIRDLKVISRTSVEKYRGQPHDMKAIGKELGVAALMEGGVQRVGNQVRINVQLIDATTDTHLWAESYDRDVSDIFAVQSEIARKVAEALKATLLPKEAEAIAEIPTQNNQAYDLYLRAEALRRPLIGKWDTEASLEAERLLQQALQLDPQFALAAVALANVRSNRWWYGPPSTQTDALAESSRTASEQALALRPGMGEAHSALATYYSYGSATGYAEGLRHAEQALSVLPNDADAQLMKGFLLARMGRLGEAESAFRRAVQLDPQNLEANGNLWQVLIVMGRHDDARPYEERMLALSDAPGLRNMAAWFKVWHLGDLAPVRQALSRLEKGSDEYFANAIDVFELLRWSRDYAGAQTLLDQFPGDWVFGMQEEWPKPLLAGLIAQDQGQKDAARKHFARALPMMLERFRDQLQSDRPFTSNTIHYPLALAYAGLGRRDDTLAEIRHIAELVPTNPENDFLGQQSLMIRAELYAMLGEKDRAVELLRQMHASRGQGFLGVGALRLSPAWDPLRVDAGFQGLLQTLEGDRSGRP